MHKRTKVMLLGVITALILAMPLAAQNYDGSVLGAAPAVSSNTKAATAGIFTNDVDNFINYHKYSTVLKDGANWFGFVTGQPYYVNPNNPTGKLKAGYARNIGSLYLGVLYQGNIYQDTGGTKDVTLTPTWNDDTRTLEQTVQETSFSEGWLNFTNQIEFLIGLSNMGIKVGFVESLYTNDHEANPNRTEKITTDKLSGTVKYEGVADEYTKSGGTLKPYVGFGMNLSLLGGTLMPYIDASVDIFSETLVDKYRSYTTYNGQTKDVEASVASGFEEGYLRPVAKIGAKFDMAKKDTVQTTLEASYSIDMKMWSSSSAASGFGGDVDGKVSWSNDPDNPGYVNRTSTYIDRTVTQTQMDLNVTEISTEIYHTGTLAYKVTGEPADGLRLGFSAAVPVAYGSGGWGGYWEQHTITNTRYNNGKSTNITEVIHAPWESGRDWSDLTVGLNLGVAASYKLIPDRFTVNAGIRATPTTWNHFETTDRVRSVESTKTTKTVDENGDVTYNTVEVTSDEDPADKVTVKDTWAGYTGTLCGGFVFYFTPAAALDLGLTVSANSFYVDLASVNVIFSVKF